MTTTQRPPYIMFTRGIPGSGKSTWAHYTAEKFPRGQVKTIALDDLRLAFDRATDHSAPRSAEDLVQDVQRHMVTTAVQAGHDVIVHNTHGSPKTPNMLRRETAGWATPVLVDFTVDLDTAKQRDAARGRTVGADVIDKLAGVQKSHRHRYKGWTILTPDDAAALLADGTPAPVPHPQYEPNTLLPDTVIVDLDGTLAKHQGRNPYDASRCEEDLFDQAVWNATKGFDRVVFLSGRDEQFRPQSERWLAANGVENPVLFMRAHGDLRSDSIVKQELFFAEVAPRFNVQVVLDDRDTVVRMWRAIGVPCFQVAPGAF